MLRYAEVSDIPGIAPQVGSVSYERQPIADHAINLASTIQLNLKRSLEALGVVCSLEKFYLPATLGYP